jgi:O-acetylserine/cysteine efflux transporter
VWSNSFIAVGYLRGADGTTARFDWISLTVARFVTAASVCGVWCFGFRRSEALDVLRAHWRRLLVCALLVVPSYNLALHYGQQNGVPAPIASLTTALVPLFLMVLSAAFLGERPTPRRLVGFVVSVTGMFLIATAKTSLVGETYPLLVAVTAIAPLSWSIYSVVSKPMTGHVSPVVWTYLSITLGGLLVLPLLPTHTWHDWSRLDASGWVALLYLAVPCTVLGFALWTWLLRHLPASSVGFTVFLNPPLTATSKFVLSALFPATFLFTIGTREWIGGAVTLAGLAIALWPASPARRTTS